MSEQIPTSRQLTGLTSTSLDRAPAPTKSFVRGKSGHVPFWPGGLDDLSADPSSSKSVSKGFRTVPPGFSRGLRLKDEISDDHELLAIDGETPETLNDGEDAV